MLSGVTTSTSHPLMRCKEHRTSPKLLSYHSIFCFSILNRLDPPRKHLFLGHLVFYKVTVLTQNTVIHLRLQKTKRLGTRANSPNHSFEEVVNDEVRLGDHNEQRDVGPAELEEKKTPRCHPHAAWQKSDVLTTLGHQTARASSPQGTPRVTRSGEQSPVVISAHILQLEPFTGENSAGPNAL